MKYPLNIFYLLLASRFAESFTPYISGGSFAKYSQYPHTVFLDISCGSRCICGGSILNQNIVLTAAHCLFECIQRCEYIKIKYGHEDIYQMKTTSGTKYVIHEQYNDDLVTNDICMVMAGVKIALSANVKRVILMANPPIEKFADVAGWGMDETGRTTSMLKHTRVEMRTPQECALISNDKFALPAGVFCAGPITGLGTALDGDSGSALVVDEYTFIQIGLVSFKCHQYSMVAYTDISYHLNWIKKHSKRLYCSK